MRFLRSWWGVLLAAGLLWAIAYLPNLGVRPLRLEEGRRATPAREMLQSGNFVLPTLYGEPYLNKPPMFFWIVAACGWMQGEVNALSTRLPSVLALLAGAVLITRFAKKDLPVETRHLSALLLLATVAMVDKGALGEIESFLAFLILAAMVCWRWGYREDKMRWLAWPLTGLILGAAALTKGPAPLVEFYLPLVVFLVWQRQWKLLFAPAHLLGVVLMAVPAGLWVWGLYAGNPAGFAATVHVWMHQTGADGAADPDGGLVRRYLKFPVETLTTFSPWVLFMVPAFVPKLAKQLGIPEDLRRYLVVYVVVTFLFFWAWPIARPRHMMAICFPIVSLAAVCIVAGWQRREAILRMALPAAVGIVVAIALGRGVYAVVVLPKLAAKDSTATAAAAFAPARSIDPAMPRFTTFTFVSQNGEGLYNAQFYFGERLAALPMVTGHGDFAILPERQVVLFCSPTELKYLESSGRWEVKRVAEADVKTPDGREVAVWALVVRRL